MQVHGCQVEKHVTAIFNLIYLIRHLKFQFDVQCTFVVLCFLQSQHNSGWIHTKKPKQIYLQMSASGASCGLKKKSLTPKVNVKCEILQVPQAPITVQLGDGWRSLLFLFEASITVTIRPKSPISDFVSSSILCISSRLNWKNRSSDRSKNSNRPSLGRFLFAVHDKNWK